MPTPEEEFAALPEDMTLGQYIKKKLDERFIEAHLLAFGIHPGECVNCLNRWTDVSP